MKLALIKIIFFYLIFIKNVCANELIGEYSLSSSGFKIGSLSWGLNFSNNTYETKIFLKSSGIFSGLYNFEGEYVSYGDVDNEGFKAKYYRQFWRTKKKTKIVEMFFNKDLIILHQEPEEAEFSRIDFNSLKGYFDPITSFINILSKNTFVNTIDGRRVYSMQTTALPESKSIKVKIQNYKNIWADHNRNDLDEIRFKIEDGEFLPRQIDVYFKNRLFKVVRR